MTDGKTMEEKMNDLMEKNRELASHAQFWKMEYKKLDYEKFQLQREYNESLFVTESFSNLYTFPIINYFTLFSYYRRKKKRSPN